MNNNFKNLLGTIAYLSLAFLLLFEVGKQEGMVQLICIGSGMMCSIGAMVMSFKGWSDLFSEDKEEAKQ